VDEKNVERNPHMHMNENMENTQNATQPLLQWSGQMQRW